jgi:hypothetical protein
MWWRAAVLAAAAGLAVAPIPAPAVEQFYSTGIYPPMQQTLTTFSNLAPFVLFDAMLIGIAVWWVVAFVRDVFDRRAASVFHALGRAIGRIVITAAVVYVVFLLTWGFNYRRVPLTSKIDFDETAITMPAARDLTRRAVDEVNAHYVQAHSELTLGDPVMTRGFAEAFARAQQTAGVRQLARTARPKRSLLDRFFRAAAVEGMTDPFFLETLMASGLLPFERPAVIAHEWSHLAGFADEGEANFIGWLTCIQASPAARYSGWLFLYREIAASLPPKERAAAASRLRPGPQRDLRAIAERVQRQVRPAVSDAGWRVYDGYLKANRIEAGAASYAEVVRLVLGSRMADRFK